ncbi:tRNA threonylcarbamoyladenosine dehydratase [Oligoflexus tunisiensis]|uniref:tRNA threonylcarbamoyladenosine dehydratase n=1 Tax=Oligoflexus tunisiensis TaxID=708132 RepID=UPI00114CE4ED|nr:tRNA threonylcarbamoyladenosine dehydratase [Oligoflexus tunisiensis]
MDAFQQRFNGIARLYGEVALERFRQAHVAVVGVGGVGSWAAEALARTGVGRLTLIDLDEVCISNTNRQLHTLTPTIGRSKVQVMAERLRSINPELDVHAVDDFFTSSTATQLLNQGYDGLVDAIDSLKNKCLLIARCQQLRIPLVTVGGAGGRRNPTKIQVADLAATSNDGLLRQVRRELRQEYKFPKDGPFQIPAVFSTEAPVFPTPEGGICNKPQPGQSGKGGCEQGYGAASFVTGTFGFAAASVMLDELLRTPAS